MARHVTETLEGYRLGVERSPQGLALIAVASDRRHLVRLPLSEKLRAELVRELSGGVVLPANGRPPS